MAFAETWSSRNIIRFPRSARQRSIFGTFAPISVPACRRDARCSNSEPVLRATILERSVPGRGRVFPNRKIEPTTHAALRAGIIGSNDADNKNASIPATGEAVDRSRLIVLGGRALVIIS